MNIPDEVMKRARSEFYHQYPLLPDRGLEATAQYIAEWARKEALSAVLNRIEDERASETNPGVEFGLRWARMMVQEQATKRAQEEVA